VWGTIQHVNLGAVDATASAAQGATIVGAPDDQPDPSAIPVVAGPDGGLGDPENQGVTTVLGQGGLLLYKGGTPENQANRPYTNSQLTLDETSQSFPGQQTSIYRMYPGSKSQQVDPDTAVISLDANLTAIAQQQQMTGNVDIRLNYHLVAAIWMDKPALFGLGPAGQGMSLQNDDGANPLVLDAVQGSNLHVELNEGASCGTPLGPNSGSGNVSGATNTVPGCVTRADVVAVGPTPAQAIAGDLSQNGTDSPFSILGGEDRLSSASMESFTQSADSFPNCFSCHNTQGITTNGVPISHDLGSPVVLQRPAMINVSHLFSEFVSQQCGGAPTAACSQ
jgi:hypothetical protein